MDIKARLAEYGREVELYLDEYFASELFPKNLRDAMRYSLLGGGKRLRGALCLAWGEMLGASRTTLLPFAGALECIHAYSLIHDDLPAMDDDDMRRGKPSCHKQFGEANAILAGDGLLTEAFVLMAKSSAAPALVLRAIAAVGKAAGAAGMVGGQVLDMEMTNKPGQMLSDLQKMHSLKTGALIQTACEAGAILAGADTLAVSRAAEYGALTGLAFQVVDDILDVIGDEKTLGKPVGSDEAACKTTYPALVGLERSKEIARQSVDDAVRCIDSYQNASADFLRELARYILTRAY